MRLRRCEVFKVVYFFCGLMILSCQTKKSESTRNPEAQSEADLMISQDSLKISDIKAASTPVAEGLQALSLTASAEDVTSYELAVCSEKNQKQFCSPSKENPYSFFVGFDDFPVIHQGLVSVFVRACKNTKNDTRTCGEWKESSAMFSSEQNQNKLQKLVSVYDYEAKIRGKCHDIRELMKVYLANSSADDEKFTELLKNHLNSVTPEMCSKMVLTDLVSELEEDVSQKINAQLNLASSPSDFDKVYTATVLIMGVSGFVTGFVVAYQGHYETKEWEKRQVFQETIGDMPQRMYELNYRIKTITDGVTSLQNKVNTEIIDYNNKNIDRDITTPEIREFLKKNTLTKEDFQIDPNKISDDAYYQKIKDLDTRLSQIQEGIWDKYKTTRTIPVFSDKDPRWMGTNEKIYYDQIASIRTSLANYTGNSNRLTRIREVKDLPAMMQQSEFFRTKIEQINAANIVKKPGQASWVDTGKLKKWGGIALSVFSASFMATNIDELSGLKLTDTKNELLSKLSSLYKEIKEFKAKVDELKQGI